MNTVTSKVPNISCGHCVNTIETELRELDGVTLVNASAADKTVVIKYQDPISESQLVDTLREINYPIQEA
jgi:copper chaperone